MRNCHVSVTQIVLFCFLVYVLVEGVGDSAGDGIRAQVLDHAR